MTSGKFWFSFSPAINDDIKAETDRVRPQIIITSLVCAREELHSEESDVAVGWNGCMVGRIEFYSVPCFPDHVELNLI
jgi:hypothetical protein